MLEEGVKTITDMIYVVAHQSYQLEKVKQHGLSYSLELKGAVHVSPC